MKFVLQRLRHTTDNPNGDYTAGFLSNEEGTFNSFTVEDTYRKEKIKGQTRIPSGFYELKLQKTDTPLTIKHRNSYKTKWFLDHKGWYHIEVTGIPNYSGVYVHSGNDDSHTAGCLLPCFAFDLAALEMPGSRSMAATDLFYSIVYPILEAGNKAFIEVRDEA